MGADEGAALLAVVALAAAHIVASEVRGISFIPRSWTLSVAGGISVAYVFVHLLPEVAKAQADVEEVTTGVLAGLERHAYVLALLGLVVFYGLEQLAVASAGRAVGDASARGAPFWLSMATFSVYGALVGHLVVRRARNDDWSALALFTLALALHFVVNDLGLRHHHRHAYDRVGRPLLIGSLLVGWASALAFELAEPTLGLVVAFLAGGIVLNVLKEELPEERSSNFGAFAGAATSFTALLLLV